MSNFGESSNQEVKCWSFRIKMVRKTEGDGETVKEETGAFSRNNGNTMKSMVEGEKS